MSLYAIGDLHLCLGAYKPMDVFGGRWEGYMDKLREGLSVIAARRHDGSSGGPQLGARHRAGGKGLCLHPRNSRPENYSQGEPRLLVDHSGKVLQVLRRAWLGRHVHPEQQLLLLWRHRALRDARLVLRAGAGGHARRKDLPARARKAGGQSLRRRESTRSSAFCTIRRATAATSARKFSSCLRATA